MFKPTRESILTAFGLCLLIAVYSVLPSCSFESRNWQGEIDTGAPTDASDMRSRTRSDAPTSDAPEDRGLPPDFAGGEEDTRFSDINDTDDVRDRGEDVVEDASGSIDPDITEAFDPRQTAECSVDTMAELYPGNLPPNPYGTWPSATDCVAAPHDALVLLGCPSREDGSPSDCQRRRVDKAMSFSRSGYGDRFIVTGAAVANEHVEAESLRDLLIEAGIPTEMIWVDTKAEHTDENIYYSSRIMVEQGWISAIFISDDPGHLMMTAICDSNCCVRYGRLTLFDFPIDDPDTFEPSLGAGHYALFPYADSVPPEECNKIERPIRAMCLNLDTRRACAGNVQLDD